VKLIGAGLPRTGTLTQKVALEMLGVGPCYHMVDVLGNLELVGQWRAALDGGGDWKTIFDGFQSTVDWPGGFFYKELIEVYPEAKVLLSVRDPAAWERSMRETVWAVYYGTSMICHLSRAAADVDGPWRDYMSLMTGLLWEDRGTLRDGHENRAGMMAAFERHTEDVKATVPADRLLVWDADDGWEPLCEFLEVDEPEIPLPHLNDSHTFKERVIDMTLGKLNGWWEQERAAQAATEAAGTR
jgi:hypothetical protein